MLAGWVSDPSGTERNVRYWCCAHCQDKEDCDWGDNKRGCDEQVNVTRMLDGKKTPLWRPGLAAEPPSIDPVEERERKKESARLLRDLADRLGVRAEEYEDPEGA